MITLEIFFGCKQSNTRDFGLYKSVGTRKVFNRFLQNDWCSTSCLRTAKCFFDVERKKNKKTTDSTFFTLNPHPRSVYKCWKDWEVLVSFPLQSGHWPPEGNYAHYLCSIVNNAIQDIVFLCLVLVWLINWLILTIFTNPSARAGYDIRSIFKRSLTGLNSEFSFS